MELTLLLVAAVVTAIIVLVTVCHFYCRVSIPGISLQDARILITGGSEGIGFSTAQACVERGANVAILARNKQKLSNAAEQLLKLTKNGNKQQILTISVDVADHDLMQQEINTALVNAKWNDLDCVICNAGVELVSSFENTSVDAYHRIMDINYFGAINTLKATLPFLKRNKLERNRYGRVLVVSSLFGLMGMAYYSAYCSSKWALRGFVESIFSEFASMNIYTSVVYPPDVATPQHEREKKVNIPQKVKDISVDSGVFDAQVVGTDIALMIEKGVYNRSWGMDGWMLLNLTSGFGIVHSLSRTLTQVFGLGLFRLIAMSYIKEQYHICKNSFDAAASNDKET